MGTGAHGPAFWPGRPGARPTRNRPVRPGPARGPGAVPGRVLIRNFRRDRPRRQFSARTATRGPAVLQIRKAHGASVSFYGLRKARSGIFPSPHTPSHAAVQVVRTWPPAQGPLAGRARADMTGRIACFTLPSLALAGILT